VAHRDLHEALEEVDDHRGAGDPVAADADEIRELTGFEVAGGVGELERVGVDDVHAVRESVRLPEPGHRVVEQLRRRIGLDPPCLDVEGVLRPVQDVVPADREDDQGGPRVAALREALRDLALPDEQVVGARAERRTVGDLDAGEPALECVAEPAAVEVRRARWRGAGRHRVAEEHDPLHPDDVLVVGALTVAPDRGLELVVVGCVLAEQRREAVRVHRSRARRCVRGHGVGHRGVGRIRGCGGVRRWGRRVGGRLRPSDIRAGRRVGGRYIRPARVARAAGVTLSRGAAAGDEEQRQERDEPAHGATVSRRGGVGPAGRRVGGAPALESPDKAADWICRRSDAGAEMEGAGSMFMGVAFLGATLGLVAAIAIERVLRNVAHVVAAVGTFVLAVLVAVIVAGPAPADAEAVGRGFAVPAAPAAAAAVSRADRPARP
jgi:hypothetical protein